MTVSVVEQDFVEATVTIQTHLADAVVGYITDNITNGVEILETNNDGLVSIKFFVFDSVGDFRPALKEYLKQISENSNQPAYSERPVVSTDWEEDYKKSIEPVFIGNNIVVRPPWTVIDRTVTYDIVIEPKMAFGTGHHETTRACLEMIMKYFKKSQRLLDFGCGSGVLGILANKMGAGYIKAVDNDPISIENAKENFEINQVSCRFDIESGSFDKTNNDTPYDLICANVNKNVLTANMDKLVKLKSESGMILLSGLIEIDKTEIEDAIAKADLHIVEYIHDGEWLTYCVNS